MDQGLGRSKGWQNDGPEPVKSVFRIDLLSPAEEQFCEFEVPSPIAVIKYKVDQGENQKQQECICVIFELMDVRTNYLAVGDIEDFEVDFSNLTI